MILLDATHAGAAAAQTAYSALPAISICIPLLALTVAIINLRLSRFPHVRAKFRSSTSTNVNRAPGVDESRFEAEVESWGLPIWDMQVEVEANCRDATEGLRTLLHLTL